MPTSGSKSNTVVFPNLKITEGGGAAAPAVELVDIRLQLSNMLQTSLELSQVVDLFFNAVKQHLSINSLSYSNEKIDTELELGKHSTHSCHYQLVTNRDAMGEISFTRRKRFSEAELELLETLIGCLINPMRNALLYREALQNALRDPLTGSGNRTAMDSTLKREVGLAQRNGTHLSLLVVDIDHFKKVNDEHGHAAGDCVLKDVAKTLASKSRATDSTYHAYRFGGEEFVMLLNNTCLTGAMIAAERIRKALEEMSTSYLDKMIQITGSIGVASLREDDDDATLFARADKALYEAKQRGRNRVISDSFIEQ